MSALAAALLAIGAADVERLLDAWDVPAAEQAAADAAIDDDAEASYVLGRLRFHQGLYGEAAARLREAVAARGEAAPSDWRALAAIAEEAEQATRGFETAASEGGHFVLRFPPGRDAHLAPHLGEALESARRAIEQDLGYAPPERVIVEIYPRVSDLARVSTLTQQEIETSGVVALCKWNRLMIVSPRALLRGYPWLDTAAHEYVHYVVSRLTRDRVPIWLHEGLARFEEQRWRRAHDGRAPLSPSAESLLAEALRDGTLVPLEKLHPSIAKLPSQKEASLAFAQVATLVEHVAARGGDGALRRLLEAIRDGRDDRQAVAAVAGAPLEAVVASWRRALKARGLRVRARPIDLSFRRDDAEQGDEPDPARDVDAKARGFARLGALLEERGRPAAAAAEYEKATAAARGGAPLVQARLARLYLETGDATRALAAAREAADAYPELAGPRVSEGLALLRLGRPAEAAPAFEAALRINPFDPRVHCGLDDAYRATADARAARAATACAALR